MDVDQLLFSEVIVEADERNRAAQDELRADVQRWFDLLTPRQKDALGGWMFGGAQYETCVALSAAACDWHHSRHQQLVQWSALQGTCISR